MSKYLISCKNMQHVINFNASLSLTAVLVYQTFEISKMAANVYNRVL